MRKKLGIFLMLIILSAALAGTQKIADILHEELIIGKKQDVAAAVKMGKYKIVIDSGHGGFDPGKVGINGVLEKDINLNIAQKLKSILEAEGIEIVMTRQQDEGLADSKTEDMKNRVEIINQSDSQLCVSIHQNSYGDEKIHGAQVFYYTHSEKGEVAAELIQQALLEVDENNTRQKKANDSYYILTRSKVPAVIVECGFLTNQEEADLLNTEEYQQKMARAIAEGILKYMTL